MRSFSSPTNINLEATRGRVPSFSNPLSFRAIGFNSLTAVSIIVPRRDCKHPITIGDSRLVLNIPFTSNGYDKRVVVATKIVESSAQGRSLRELGSDF